VICAVCLYARTGPAPIAITVINGYAVCEDHTPLVAQGSEWNSILVIAGRRVREGVPFQPTASPVEE
jgi:hypothetical protein